MSQSFTAQLNPGVPVPGPPGPQGPAGPQGPPGASTPWESDVDGGGFDLDNVNNVNITGHFFRGGVQLSISNQNVVTGSRAAGVAYQNTTGKTMFVMISWNLQGKATTIDTFSDSSNPPTTLINEIADPSNSSGVTLELFFMVLPGNYYQCTVTQGTPTVVTWVEYT